MIQKSQDIVQTMIEALNYIKNTESDKQNELTRVLLNDISIGVHFIEENLESSFENYHTEIVEELLDKIEDLVLQVGSRQLPDQKNYKTLEELIALCMRLVQELGKIHNGGGLILEQVIICGTSKDGKKCYKFLKDNYEIISFTDFNENKEGLIFCGKSILSLEQAVMLGKKIIIADTDNEIKNKATEFFIKVGYFNVEIFNISLVRPEQFKLMGLENMQKISLGNFLQSFEAIHLEDLVFAWGGSGVLDYAFLRALILKFGLKNYLEIGTFIGESISSLSDLTEKCYSISLPNEYMVGWFAQFNKENFGKYFSLSKKNVTHYECDSKNFDYRNIKEDIDLVYIDGDHSYNGICIDTKKIFEFINLESTIVVWHDFKNGSQLYNIETVSAIFTTLDKNLHKNIFEVSDNMCCVYLPQKYINSFNLFHGSNEKDVLFSYKTTISCKKNHKSV